MPDALIHSVLASSGNARTSVIVSNVRGPPSELHVGNDALSSLIGFLPAPAGCALGIGIGSYSGSLTLSVASDRALLGAASEEFLELMLSEYNAYRAEAHGVAQAAST